MVLTKRKETRNLLKLNNDVIFHIVTFSKLDDVGALARTCRSASTCVNALPDTLWRSLAEKEKPLLHRLFAIAVDANKRCHIPCSPQSSFTFKTMLTSSSKGDGSQFYFSYMLTYAGRRTEEVHVASGVCKPVLIGDPGARAEFILPLVLQPSAHAQLTAIISRPIFKRLKLIIMVSLGTDPRYRRTVFSRHAEFTDDMDLVFPPHGMAGDLKVQATIVTSDDRQAFAIEACYGYYGGTQFAYLCQASFFELVPTPVSTSHLLSLGLQDKL
jgi:hypothetical protein